MLAKPGASAHTKFKGEVYVLTKEEGGRHTPFFTGYRPQFYFRTTDVTGVATLPEGVEMVMPGDNTQMTVELIAPIAMEKGLRFAIREGGRTVGAGPVTDIVEEAGGGRDVWRHARQHHPPVPGLQAPELRHHEEQEEDHGAAGALQVLPLLPQAHCAQGDQVSRRRAERDSLPRSERGSKGR